MFRPSRKGVIQPALDRFNAARDSDGVVPLSTFPRASLGPAGAYALLAKVEGVRTDIRYEWIGDQLSRLYGHDASGARITTQLPKRFADDALSSYRRAAITKDPIIERRTLKLKGFIPYGYWRAMFPLSESGPKISHILVYVLPDLWWLNSRRDLRLDPMPSQSDRVE
ncbi:MAG: hypothetical protein AAF556_09850 [Pseudomonadota bacterium]